MIDITPDQQSQIDFEHLYNNNQTMKRLRREFESDVELLSKLSEERLPPRFVIDLLCQMVLHKRATASVLIGILHHHFEDEKNPFQSCADALIEAAKADFVDLEEVWKTYSGTATLTPTFIVRIDVSADVYEDLERYQFPLPMLIPPRPIKNNMDSGYLTFRDSVILKDNHHEDDAYLGHLNRANSVAYSINPEVNRMVENKWRNLDKQKPGETVKDYQKRVKAFEKYTRTAKDIIDHLIMVGNKFWLTHRYDKRGRVYPVGHHVNPQGNPWNKAVLEFSNKEVVKL